MSTMLFPELAREKAASNRRIAHSVELAVQELEQTQETQSMQRRMTQSAQEALRHTIEQAEQACTHWRTVVAAFTEGLEGSEAREMLQVSLELFEAWFSLLRPTQVLCQRAAAVGAAPKDAARLDDAVRTVTELRGAAEELRTYINAPRPSVDAAVLERALAAVAEGRFKSSEEVRQRLHERQP